MIPYIDIPHFSLWGPFAVQPFGILVVTGMMLGMRYVEMQSKVYGLNWARVQASIWACLLIGLFLSHVFDVIFYFPERIRTDGILTLFRFWEGLSSYGGFVGAVLVLVIWYRGRWTELLHVSEVIVQSLPIGWVFGRAGCAVVHDHPGMRTDHWLAVQFPSGPRLDLGLMEFLYTLLVLVPATLLYRKYARRLKLPWGSSIVLMALLYAPVRFILDFYRATDLLGADKRYWGLTAAQYASIALFGFGIVMWLRIRKRPPALKMKG